MLEKCLSRTSPVPDTIKYWGPKEIPGFEDFKGKRDRSKQIIDT